MILWIILGTLVGVVVIFLVVASVLDRKKAKKVKVKKEEHDKSVLASRGNVAIWVNLLIAENKTLLDQFVPSVGKIKMHQIKDKAKKALEEFAYTEEYKLLSSADVNQDVINNLNLLRETNSNIWAKNCAQIIDFFKEEENKLEVETYADFKIKAQEKIKEIYSNEHTK